MHVPLLQEFVLLLAVAVATVFVSQKIKAPSIVGFLLTGILLGPSGLRLVGNAGEIAALAEIGVVMLLFTIGIEFSLDTLKQIRRTFWLGGGIQVVLTILVVVGGLLLLERPAAEAVMFGFLLTQASTTVLMKVYSDRDETDSVHFRATMGILLFQDIAFVPMAALVPVLASAGEISVGKLGLRLGLSLLALSAAFLVARYVMPGVLFRIVRTRLHELFLITTLFVCLGMALLSSALGLSLALGAFLAGVIISESPYSHQVVSDILPFKDLFSSIFFISIGMLLDIRGAWAARSIIPFLILGALAIKILTGYVAARTLRFPPRTAFLSGLGLIPIGEFSFVLAGLGRATRLLSETSFQAFIATSILTILVTPLFIESGSAWSESLGRLFKWKREKSRPGKGPRDIEGHVIIAGYGLNGRNLAKVLKEAGIGYVILELNPETVRKAAAEQEPIIFGDVSSRTVLREAGIDKAKIMVFAISDPKTTRRGVRAAREMSRDLYIIVRTRYTVDVDKLYELGANDVIPEEFETSIEIFSRVLDRLHVARNMIDAQVKVVRGECYGMLRGTCSAVRPAAERIGELLEAGTAETYFVGQEAWPAGKTLRALDLRGRTGATVIAVVRGEESFTSPGADFEIREMDTLILVASHRDIDRAFSYLASGE